MELTQEVKNTIDKMSYHTLLERWRNAPVGDAWFQGAVGDYWAERMKTLRNSGADHTGASKRIGWD